MLPDLEQWLSHFKHNEVADDGIDWTIEEELTSGERRCIAASMAKFQLGEYSEGKGLMKFVTEYARHNNAENLIQITRLFVKAAKKIHGATRDPGDKEKLDGHGLQDAEETCWV